MYINISLNYHRITGTQSRIIANLHDLLGQPSYLSKNTICIEGHSDDQIVRGAPVWLLSGPPGLPVGFLLLWYSVLCTVGSLSCFISFLYIDLYIA